MIGVLALALAPAPALADGPTVTYDGGYADSDGLAYVQTTAVTAHVQDPSAGDGLQCQVDGGPSGPCGTQDATCPVAQCWTYSFTGVADGFNHDLTVDAGPRNAGSVRYDNYFRVAPDPPPDPTLQTPPQSDLDFAEPLASERPEFQFGAASDGPGNAPLSATQCAVAPAASTTAASWLPCTSGKPLPQRLALLGTYRVQLRAVDVFGRADPNPPQYVFSPTPCRPRLVGRPRSLRRFASHGIRVRVHCVQRVGRGSFVDLSVSEGEANRLGLPGAVLASAYVRTTRLNQTVVVALRGLNKLPRYVFGVRHLNADLVAVQRNGYGYLGFQHHVVRP